MWSRWFGGGGGGGGGGGDPDIIIARHPAELKSTHKQ
jgi:hypothetical protein